MTDRLHHCPGMEPPVEHVTPPASMANLLVVSGSLPFSVRRILLDRQELRGLPRAYPDHHVRSSATTALHQARASCFVVFEARLKGLIVPLRPGPPLLLIFSATFKLHGDMAIQSSREGLLAATFALSTPENGEKRFQNRSIRRAVQSGSRPIARSAGLLLAPPLLLPLPSALQAGHGIRSAPGSAGPLPPIPTRDLALARRNPSSKQGSGDTPRTAPAATLRRASPLPALSWAHSTPRPGGLPCSAWFCPPL